MPDNIITNFTELTQAAAADDLPIVDVSDTTQSGAGTTKRIQEQNLLMALYSLNCSGFDSWTSGADSSTYTLTGGKFQIDRSGQGYILGRLVTWTAGLQTGTLTANATSWIYVDTDGLLHASTTYPPNKIILYEVLYDGTNYVVVKENHPYSFPSAVSSYLHNTLGTTIRGTGAVIMQVSNGNGSVITDRQVMLYGVDTLDDHGISTAIPDSNGFGVSWNVYYRNASSQWTKYATSLQLTSFYNNSGTPTALAAANYGIYTLYASKDDIENSAPTYFAVMDENTYSLLAAAQAAITNKSCIAQSAELKSIELARLGFAIVQYQATNAGSIYSVTVDKNGNFQNL
jgi:hypothetical protein